MHAQQERLEEDLDIVDIEEAITHGVILEDCPDRRRGQLLIISDVPAGVCQQCGEKYFQPVILKRMDTIYHDIFDRGCPPARVLEVPAVSFSLQ